MRKKIIPPILILVILLAGWAYYTHNGNGKAVGQLFYGNIDYRTVQLGFRVPGKLTTMPYEEGTQVKKGDVLATLDTAPYDELIIQTEARVAAQKALTNKLTKGFRPEEIALAKATLDDAKALLERNTKNYKRQLPLYKSHAISEQQFDDIRFAYESAQAKAANATAALELKQKGYRKEDIEQAKAALDALQALLAKQRLDLADAKLTAPYDGILLLRIKEPGSVVGYGEPVAELARNDSYWVRSYLEEPDLGKIKVGMAAEVFTDSEPGHPYKGTVSFISPTAEFTPKSVQTPELRTDLVYRFKITLENTDGGIRQGMPVTIKLPELSR